MKIYGDFMGVDPQVCMTAKIFVSEMVIIHHDDFMRISLRFMMNISGWWFFALPL